MTTIPRTIPRLPTVSHLPPECRGSSFSFAPAVTGRDCTHCAEYGLLRDRWLDDPGDLDAFHSLVDHIQGVSSPEGVSSPTCPTCATIAAALPLFSQQEPQP